MSSSQPPPPPNTAVIPLPPGMTLGQFQELQGLIVSIAISSAVAVALVIWDYLTLLPDEIALYRSSDKNLWKAPGTWAFVVLRYAGILALIPSLFFTSLQTQYCQLTASLSQGGVVLVTASAGLIFCYRVFSIWRDNNLIRGFVGFLWLFMVGSWIATSTQLRATVGPHTPFGSNCILHPVPAWSPLAFASSVTFDCIVLFLTIIKLREVSNSNIGRQIIGDNLMYFLLVTITNLVVLVIQALGPNLATTIKPMSLPYPTLVTYAMGTRVFLNLRLYNQRKMAGREAFSMGSSSNGNGKSFHATAPRHNFTSVAVDVVQSTWQADSKPNHLV